MKTFRLDSPLEKKLQQVEALMVSLEIKLTFSGYGILVESENVGEGIIKDIESDDASTTFPRMFDSERIVVEE